MNCLTQVTNTGIKLCTDCDINEWLNVQYILVTTHPWSHSNPAFPSKSVSLKLSLECSPNFNPYNFLLSHNFDWWDGLMHREKCTHFHVDCNGFLMLIKQKPSTLLKTIQATSISGILRQCFRSQFPFQIILKGDISVCWLSKYPASCLDS
jgi:hypothetical protein